jgi:hypothetical protein
LRKKYLRGKGFFGNNNRGASQFWKGLHDAKTFVKGGRNTYMGMGRRSDSGMRFGWVDAHSGLNIESYSTSVTSMSGRSLGFWRVGR